MFLQVPAAARAWLLPQMHGGARAGADAKADGVSVPGLIQPAPIERLGRDSSLPVNVMNFGAAPGLQALARRAVARITYGPLPRHGAMLGLAQRFQAQTGMVAGADAKKA